MKKSAAQLTREIDTELARSKSVNVAKLFAWMPKLSETIVDVHEGRRSYNTGKPIVVSQLDSPRGAYFIIDGHHRAVEAVLAGKATIAVEIDRHVPRIERTGGAHRESLENKVNVLDYVRRDQHHVT